MLRRFFCALLAAVLLCTACPMAAAASLDATIRQVDAFGHLWLSRSASEFLNAGWKDGDTVEATLVLPYSTRTLTLVVCTDPKKVQAGSWWLVLLKNEDTARISQGVGSAAVSLGITANNAGSCRVKFPAGSSSRPVVTPRPVATPQPAASRVPVLKDGLTSVQRNAMALMNWLSVASVRIGISPGGRLLLDGIYSSLHNDVNRFSVDEKTLTYMEKMLDTIQNFRMFAEKRNHIQYILEQEESQAVWKGVAGALDDLKIDSKDWVGSAGAPAPIAVGIINTAIQVGKGVLTWQQARHDARMTSVNSGWDLDADESNELHKLQNANFRYTWEMARDFNLDGRWILTENTARRLVELEEETDDLTRLRMLEPMRDECTYCSSYWLMLAESYYNTGEWQKCLDAVDFYLSMDIGIFLRDRELAEAIPLAIGALSWLSRSDADFIKRAMPYLTQMRKNTPTDDWRLHISSAMIYLDFCLRTPKGQKNTRLGYYRAAWDEISLVLPGLVREQRRLNEAWLGGVVHVSVADGLTRAQKAEREAYNRMLDERRKTEFPPIYEPLRLCIELLQEIREASPGTFEGFAAEYRLDEILHRGNEVLFWNEYMENLSWFQRKNPHTYADDWHPSCDNYIVGFTGDLRIYVPITQVTEESRFTLAAMRRDSNGIATAVGLDVQLRVFRDAELISIDRTSDPGRIWAVYESPTLTKESCRRLTYVNAGLIDGYLNVAIGWHQSGPTAGKNRDALCLRFILRENSTEPATDEERRQLYSVLPKDTWERPRLFNLLPID